MLDGVPLVCESTFAKAALAANTQDAERLYRPMIEYLLIDMWQERVALLL